MPPTNKSGNKLIDDFRKKLSRLAFPLMAFLFHLVLFLMVATCVIFSAPEVHETTASFGQIKIPPVPPPPLVPPSASGSAAQTAMEPTLQVVPPQAPQALSVVTSSVNNTFSVNSVKVPLPPLSSVAPPQGSGLGGLGASGTSLGSGSVFGSENQNGNTLAGFFYDLKQTPDHTPTGMNGTKEQALLKQFFKDGWNEDDWTPKFLKGPKPLYANELLVPFILSKEGPKAYGLEKVCKPGYWCAIYHLKVNPTHTGTYRVAGYGDDFLVVRVDGRVVLDAGWFHPVTDFQRTKKYPPKWLDRPSPGRPDYGQTVVGYPFQMEVGQSLSIDVFIGDAEPGATGQGRCGYFLFLLDDSKQYDNDAGGNPIFPVLQVQPEPNLNRPGERPPFTSNPGDSLTGS